jgi:hypothetical protein
MSIVGEDVIRDQYAWQSLTLIPLPETCPGKIAMPVLLRKL